MPKLEQNNLAEYPLFKKEEEGGVDDNDVSVEEQIESEKWPEEGEISQEEWAAKKGYDPDDPLLEYDLDLAKANADRIIAQEKLEKAQEEQDKAERERKRREFEERLRNTEEDREENERNFVRF